MHMYIRFESRYPHEFYGLYNYTPGTETHFIMVSSPLGEFSAFSAVIAASRLGGQRQHGKRTEASLALLKYDQQWELNPSTLSTRPHAPQSSIFQHKFPETDLSCCDHLTLAAKSKFIVTQ